MLCCNIAFPFPEKYFLSIAKVRKIFDTTSFFSRFYIIFNAIYSFISIIISNFVSKNKIVWLKDHLMIINIQYDKAIFSSTW
jgi:hypothetical protein